MSGIPMFSVIIPAHNEEDYIERCIRSIRRAARELRESVEIIVVCNRCMDSTADIAASLGAKVLTNHARSIALVRNEGIKAARGSIIVTIDADNRMSPGTLREIKEKLTCGKYIGGGAPIRFERDSFPLFLNDLMVRTGTSITGLYSGIFWAKKETFDAIGGFVNRKAMEDVATARKLKKYGKGYGLKYTSLKENYLLNSTRKFDDMGDWLYFKLLFRNAGTFLKALLGDKRQLDKLLDELFYDYRS